MSYEERKAELRQGILDGTVSTLERIAEDFETDFSGQPVKDFTCYFCISPISGEMIEATDYSLIQNKLVQKKYYIHKTCV